MDKITKLQSVQGFSFSKDGLATTASKSLLDFQLPSSGVFNLKDSYININVSVDAPDASPDATEGTGINLVQFHILDNPADAANNRNTQMKNVALVKNAQMTSQNRGMIESIRRVNTLRMMLDQVENSLEDKQGNDHLNATTIRDENGLVYSPVRDVVVVNSVAGTIDTTLTTTETSHDIRIPVGDIFNIGNMRAFPADRLGQVQIHLEMDLKRLTARQVLGAADGVYNDNSGYNDMENFVQTADGANMLVLKSANEVFKDDSEIPFYVGQKVEIEATANGGAGAITGLKRTIQGIEMDDRGGISITFNNAFITGLTAAHSYTNIKLKGVNAASVTININHAEIVLKEVMEPVDVPSQIPYTSYSVEEDNGNNLASFNRQYILEPNCNSLLVALPSHSDGLMSNLTYNSYRLLIDNEDQTLRDVVRNKPLQIDRLMRYCKNRGVRCKNNNHKVRNINLSPSHDANFQGDLGAHMNINSNGIYEPMPITDRQKLVNLSIQSAGVNDIILYKQVLKVL